MIKIKYPQLFFCILYLENLLLRTVVPICFDENLILHQKTLMFILNIINNNLLLLYLLKKRYTYIYIKKKKEKSKFRKIRTAIYYIILLQFADYIREHSLNK